MKTPALRLHIGPRWIALAILGIVVALPLAGLAVEARMLLRAGEERDEIAARVADLERVAARQPGLLQRRDALRASLGQGDRFLAGANAAIGGANLQRLVGTIIDGAGAQMEDAAVLPAREEGAYLRVGLRVTLSTRIDPLQRVLYAVESGLPDLFIDDLEIRTAEPGAADPVLSITFQVYGYMPGAGKPA
ncbi:type II secretion system protein GspM [Inquilinus sp. NPDC058860]|uniref:type II secretion system protein GspM n=1 Tax=Inquilinus sp. NPDC058860 TaxID=3346652 RepID=UPI0036CA8D71